MSICSVCGKNVPNVAAKIIRGKSGEWICKDCLNKAGISSVSFSSTFITSDQIQSLIKKRNAAVINQSQTQVGNKNLRACKKCGTVYSGNYCPNGCNSPYYQKQKKKGKVGIAASIVIGVFGFAAMMGILFGEETLSDTTSNSTPASTSRVEEIQYIEVTANDLYSAYEDNEVKAEQTYKGKNIKITGIVSEINSAETFSSASVLLNVDDSFIGCVQCCFNSSEEAKALANLKKGQSVTIVGVCGKLELWNVMVTGCEVK